MNWKWILVLILLLLLAIFSVQNYEIVKIQFLFWSFQTSRAIVIFSALFIGIIIGLIISLIKRG
ncbi:MAG: lipopolysaccharide assembly protein LapA domain-containing protein [Candidatus Omnitrophica bacterium]|nr:lipopolysaccharide assembly protein LapA domain-containing protein [Candidatus Omnitrophota bacterium]MDD5079756.1 lipopolysaccharide assembly protein LapA domain-containing protein [Candidatus Omnitrophota bacterium]